MKTFDPSKTIYLIDGSSFLYRAYYAMKPLHTKEGESVQAVYGFVRMIKKLINQFNPTYMAVVWDSPGKTARHHMLESYKATRKAPPIDLFEQKKRINEFNKLIGLHEFQVQGIEADDLMFSLGQDMLKLGYDVILITSDKDMGQIIGDHIYIYDTFKDVLYDKHAFEQKMGLAIAKLPFYFALLGDASDNIPGVRGIGQKGALELVTQFDSLEHMYANLDHIAKPRMRAALQEQKQNALLSYELFLLRYQPTNITDTQLAFKYARWAQARAFFQQLNFVSLLKELSQTHDDAIDQEVKKKLTDYQFKTITEQSQLTELVNAIKQKGICAIDTETTGVQPLIDQLVGISLALEPGIAYYIPLDHKTNEQQLDKDNAFALLKPILENASIKKIMHNAAFDTLVLWNAGITLKGIVFDTLLAAKLVNKEWQSVSLKALSETYLHEQMLTYQEVVKDNKYKDFSYVPLELATEYAAADAHQTLRLYPLLEQLLYKERQMTLFQEIEQPLQRVLLAMEQQGIFINKDELAQLGKRVVAELIEIEDAIIKQVGPSYAGINLNSPKQVEHLLFQELKLAPGKKSATGRYSTNSQVLQALAKEHQVPGLIAKYRELFKLKSTYIDALPMYIHPKTSKIHTHFNQVIVATGRLSSSDPNLQNIPADAHGYGIEVRAAFKANQQEVFLSADYSQIELRVLAYLTQDSSLVQAFERNVDIHTQTATRLFNISQENVTHQQRQTAKRINFSVLYGLTPYGLSKDLGISFKEAKIYIDTYFAQYPLVSSWMESVVQDVKQKGYATTLYGRRRYLSAIYESNQALYQEAVRIAVNTVVQGTAAEIMKIGMIRLYDALQQHAIAGHIILQIHDELLLGVAKEQVQDAQKIVKEVLEGATSWNVPLQVTTRIGNTWKDVTK